MNQLHLLRIFMGTLMICAGSVVDAKKLYRWEDESGKTFYSDRVPPDQVKSERSILDSQGIEVGKIDKAKSREQLELEYQRQQALEKLRAEQNKLIAIQEASDRILLSTFSSEEDITLARDNKLGSIDVAIQILQTNIIRAKDRLANKQKDAANLERQGQKASQRLEEDIALNRQKLSTHYSTMIGREREKEVIFAQYEKDMSRFRELKDIQAPVGESEQDKSRYSSLLNTVYPCASAESCKQLWDAAGEFLRSNSTTRVQLSGDTIILTAPPKAAEDLSITISLLDQKDEDAQMIFMDLQCSTGPSGREFCNSEKVNSIKHKFGEVMAMVAAQGTEQSENSPAQ